MYQIGLIVTSVIVLSLNLACLPTVTAACGANRPITPPEATDYPVSTTVVSQAQELAKNTGGYLVLEGGWPDYDAGLFTASQKVPLVAGSTFSQPSLDSTGRVIILADPFGNELARLEGREATAKNATKLAKEAPQRITLLQQAMAKCIEQAGKDLERGRSDGDCLLSLDRFRTLKGYELAPRAEQLYQEILKVGETAVQEASNLLQEDRRKGRSQLRRLQKAWADTPVGSKAEALLES